MSGYPNAQDITELRNCLLALKAEEAAVTKAVAEKAQAQTRLDGARDRVEEYIKKINALMTKMDVASPGNTGYKDRLLELLAGLAEK